MPHQVLRYGRNNPILLQTMIHGVSQGVKMELARWIFGILDAGPFQILAERFSFRKNPAKDPIRRCRTPLLLELLESSYDFRVKRERLQLPVFGVLGLHHDMRVT
ncbi:MAG: hypothetical protein WBV90_05510 [Terrimicrobiaceae bacterium]